MVRTFILTPIIWRGYGVEKSRVEVFLSAMRNMQRKLRQRGQHPVSIYPTSTCAQNKSASRKGYFDNLQQFVAVGFNIDDDGERDKVMTGELEKGAIFHSMKKKRVKSTSCQ